jgi:hypothetical protein
MRSVHASVTAIAAAVALSTILGAQGAQNNQDIAVKGGGVTVPGWKGIADTKNNPTGLKVTDAKFEPVSAGGFHVQTGPAITYYHPSNVATGDYTVSAAFEEPKFQNLNDHPHPYGIVIAGNKMDTPDMTLLYCAAYGNGTFIVRGFGPAPFNLNGPRGAANAAVKSVAVGSPVTQIISMMVKGDTVSCSINGTQVWSAPKADLVGTGPGKIMSTDGVYGIRTAHNVEFNVTGFGKK